LTKTRAILLGYRSWNSSNQKTKIGYNDRNPSNPKKNRRESKFIWPPKDQGFPPFGGIGLWRKSLKLRGFIRKECPNLISFLEYFFAHLLKKKYG
jgi:hypothetical protein